MIARVDLASATKNGKHKHSNLVRVNTTNRTQRCKRRAERACRLDDILRSLQDLASVITSDRALVERISTLRDTWFPARDQYQRSILHIASTNGNARLVRALVYSGALINARDGIGQTPLTLAIHKGHTMVAKFLMENGATVRAEMFPTTIPPLEIARANQCDLLIEILEQRIEEEDRILNYLKKFYPTTEVLTGMETTPMDAVNFARFLNINVGDQKNTVTIQGCSNKCPDIYGCHTPGGGDFHNRGYVNDAIARIAGPGGFWFATESIMKRPTVNPASFKSKFKNNNYNNNEEALLDYDDGLSIAMVKMFESSVYFPTEEQLEKCLSETKSHNHILLEKFEEWLADLEKSDEVARYHLQFTDELMPITRWYKESIRNGNGMAIEGVWMLCPGIYTQMGKTNYRDESFTQIVNTIAKWPLAYRMMYQQNRTVNLDNQQGKQLAGDEWVEDFLVRPVKQFTAAQSSFKMVELMSCSVNLLEMNRNMYKNREAFNVHNTRKHEKPSSFYDQLKVAQFVLKEQWLMNKDRKDVLKYSWGEKKGKSSDKVPAKCINAIEKGNTKASGEFNSFLQRKFPNDMM